MPQTTDLVGLGMPSQLAAVMGNDPNLVTCAGTSQTTATTIKTHMPELSAAGGATGAILQSTAKIGTPYFVLCSSSTSAVLYPPVGQYINSAQNGSFTLAQNKTAIVWQYKLNYWVTNLTA